MSTKINARVRRRIQQAKSRTDAQALRYARPHCAFIVTLGNVDLPAFVSDGRLYIQAPLPHVFKAFAEDISAFIRDMEIGISTEGGTTLSFDRYGRPLPCAELVESHVVRDSEVE